MSSGHDQLTSLIIDQIVEKPIRDRKRKEELEHAQKLAEIQKGATADRIIWTGTSRQLGDLAMKLWKDGKGPMKATSFMNALEQLEKHFVLKNGKSPNARSIWQSLQNRQDYEPKKNGWDFEGK